MKNNIFNKVKNATAKLLFIVALPLCAIGGSLMSSCSDDMSGTQYYTFTGQMMSEALKANPNLSEFTTIVTRAGMMDQLSAYGHYTCFPPTNEAIDNYLASKGKTMDDLTDADCDTIAKTHLLSAMYSTTDLSKYDSLTLGSQNMMRRNLNISHKENAQKNIVFVINGNSALIDSLQDDSVENGIMHPIDAVIVNDNSTIASLLKKDKNLTLYYQALVATGLEQMMDTMIEDKTYNADDYSAHTTYNTGAEGEEWAVAPDSRKYGFTAFMVPDNVLQSKGISTLEDLYNKACSIYDSMYPEDVNKEGHDFSHLNDSINPLYRFMAYHILDRNLQGYNTLTVREDLGVVTSLVNPVDWYSTLLPYTILKMEHVKQPDAEWSADAISGDYYINRRTDDSHPSGSALAVPGVHVQNITDNDAINGIYFYVDDILAFDETVQNTVDNCRIRMDMSTIFPELVTNNIRMNGKYTDYSRKLEKSASNDVIGYNYFFPDNPKTGKNYLEGVKLAGTNTRFVYRRPRINFYSMHGDEMNGFGVFDITFNLPPFPFEGTWQIRLGFAPMTSAPRGAIQFYFDGKVTGIPLNMDLLINSEEVYGATTFPTYSNIRSDEDERLKDFKILKNKGYYRGPYSVYHNSSANELTGEKFADQPSTVRKVICTINISKEDLHKTHTLRFKNVSTVNAINKEAMLDYIEFVPSSVFSVGEDGSTEDDL